MTHLSTIKRLAKAITFLSVIVAGATGCGPELGEAVYTVPLTYNDSSDFGPTDATGTAIIDTATGQVTITVEKLPQRTGEVYEGWLAGGGETALSTGRFNTGPDATGGSDITVGSLLESTFTEVIITVEPEPDSDPGPDPRHSIAGDIEVE